MRVALTILSVLGLVLGIFKHRKSKCDCCGHTKADHTAIGCWAEHKDSVCDCECFF